MAVSVNWNGEKAKLTSKGGGNLAAINLPIYSVPTLQSGPADTCVEDGKCNNGGF